MRSAILGLCAIALLLCVVPAYAEDDCVATCKVGPPQTTQEIDKAACEATCDAYCAPFETNLKSCVFKEQNIKGNCVAECKDGRVDNDWHYTAPECLTQCDDFCGTNADVKACYFKSVAIKGNCDVYCKDETFDHIMLPNTAYPEATPTACVTACDDFCVGKENVKACVLKGDNLKGGICSAKCKDETSGTRPAQDKGDCHLRCDDICGGDKANVLWCQFKEQNVKGNCDVTCKDELSDHIMLPSTNPPHDNTTDECQTWCKDMCAGHGGTLTCDHKGDPTVPTVTAWGLVVMGLLVLTAGTSVVLRRRTVTA